MFKKNNYIVHLMTDTSRGFMEPFIKFVNNNFDADNHLFLIIGPQKWKNLNQYNTIYFTDISRKEFYELLDKAEKLVLHSFTSPIELVYLLRKKNWRKKTFWIVWGGDLYQYIHPKDLKIFTYGMLRKFIVPDFKGICTLVNEDFEIAKKMYHYKGKKFSAIYINEETSKLITECNSSRKESQNNVIKILVGNSATQSNCQLEILNILEKWKNKNICIISPLSYGDEKYGDEVEKIGKRIFGEKFVALRSMIPFEQYIQLLSEVDIGIFNNNRQQALANIYSLISLKKKVYLRNNATYKQLTDIDGVKIHNVNELKTISFEDFVFVEKDVMIENKQKIDEKNSVQNAKKIWSAIFNAQ